MGFWDYVRTVADKMAPPQVKMEANDIHLNPSPVQLTERQAARLARLEAALVAGDRRASVAEEIAQIKKGIV